MSTLAEELRTYVRQRSGNRCEYCLSHQNYILGRLQIDHIIPLAKGGLNSEENLCLACELCNQHKWTKTEGYDSQTGHLVRRYHPRRQVWSEHFGWSENSVLIIGLSACGRATINALQLNNALAITVRRNWIRAGWHPPS